MRKTIRRYHFIFATLGGRINVVFNYYCNNGRLVQLLRVRVAGIGAAIARLVTVKVVMMMVAETKMIGQTISQ
jgi:hypothetical protein